MTRLSCGIRAAALTALLLAGGCIKPAEKPTPGPVVEIVPEPEWRTVASEGDLQRIERTSAAWAEALDEARRAGFTRAIEGEGPLLDPEASLPRPAPSPGSYRCRMIKLGTQGKIPAFNAFKPFFCYVEVQDDQLNIVKQTGTQRPAGWLYEDDDKKRLVFLGTLALGTEEAPLPYGENPERDMAGVLERVGPFRYRLVIPWPRQESKLDIIELVPVIE
jgi:hypothetical protein